MAEATLTFLLEYIVEHVTKEFRGGDKVVRWIEYELETLIPQLERAPDADLTDLLNRAEVLAETYTKKATGIKASGYIIKPIASIGIVFTTKKLHKIRDAITEGTKKLSESNKGGRQGADQRSFPPYLRRFIRYFILFPPDFKVPARRMIALWVAEGLVHSKKHDMQSVEKIAERYLDELRKLGLVSVERNRSGKVKRCSIAAALRDELLKEAENEEAAAPGSKISKTRWLVDSNGSTGDFFIEINGNQTTTNPMRPKYKDVISFLSFNTQEGSKPGEDIGDFLRKCISDGYFTWLNVLDLEKVFRPKLPTKLGKLIALKYLGLRWTYLENLPASVERLFNLQVLDVKHTYISILPRSIWRMQYLIHLYLSEAYRTRFPDPPSTVALTALQTLWGAFVDEDTCVVNGLDRSLSIRKLGLSCRWRESKTVETEEDTSSPDGLSKTCKMSKQLEAIDKWISNLKYLESLRLKSRDESGNAAPLHLTSLEGNKDLSTVYLLGKLDLLILCKLPVSLTDVTLSGSDLDVDPMPFLARLPNLVILRLLGQSVVCSKMHCSRRGFRKLKFLYIWKLEKLLEFEAEDESLSSLEELEIRSCGELKQLPDRLREIQNLKIKLTSMKPDFVRRAGSKYAKVEHVPKDDQYILTNTPTFGHETHDLISSCFIDYEHSISRNNAPGSIF